MKSISPNIISQLVSFIHPPDLCTMLKTLSIGKLLHRPTFGQTSNTMSACFFYLFLLIFFSSICHREKNTSAVFQTKNLLGN